MIEMPHSVEAEQQLLGALLLDASRLHMIPDACPGWFYDPLHCEIFEVIEKRARADELVSPVAIAAVMDPDAFAGVNGTGYLARMAGGSISGNQVRDYGSMLADLSDKRALVTAMGTALREIGSGSTAADVAGKLEAALIAAAGTGRSGPVSMMKAISDAIEEALAAYRGESTAAIRSGIPALDRMLGGFYPGELILLGGRPSMGKTGVALAIALNAAREGHGVAIASLEMTPASLAMRALSEQTAQSKCAVEYSSMRRGAMSEQHARSMVEASRTVADLPVQILPQTFRDIGALYSGAKQAKRLMRGNMRLLIVDYLQLLKSPARTRIEQITEISIALKSLAAQLDVPIIALSQLSRAVESREEKRPVLSDLRESGQLEQDADTVLFCYRDEYYLDRDEPDISDAEAHDAWRHAKEHARNKLEIIVSKQRQGEVGTAHVRFNPALNLIWEN